MKSLFIFLCLLALISLQSCHLDAELAELQADNSTFLVDCPGCQVGDTVTVQVERGAPDVFGMGDVVTKVVPEKINSNFEVTTKKSPTGEDLLTIEKHKSIVKRKI